MVFIGEKVVVAGTMAEMVVSDCVTSLRRSFGRTVALVRSLLLWDLQLGFTGDYGLGVSLVLVKLTSMRPGKVKWEESSRCIRRRSCSIWCFGVEDFPRRF